MEGLVKAQNDDTWLTPNLLAPSVAFACTAPVLLPVVLRVQEPPARQLAESDPGSKDIKPIILSISFSLTAPASDLCCWQPCFLLPPHGRQDFSALASDAPELTPSTKRLLSF